MSIYEFRFIERIKNAMVAVTSYEIHQIKSSEPQPSGSRLSISTPELPECVKPLLFLIQAEQAKFLQRFYSSPDPLQGDGDEEDEGSAYLNALEAFLQAELDELSPKPEGFDRACIGPRFELYHPPLLTESKPVQETLFLFDTSGID